MVLRKFMIWSIITILIFSTLSFTVSTRLSTEQQRENETQAFIDDAELLALNEKRDLQDFTERADDDEQKLLTEPIESMGPQFLTETEQKKVPPNQTEFEISDFESENVRTVGVGIYSDSSINNPLSSIDWGNLESGGNMSIECYVQNEGKTFSTLTLETANWTPPEAATYLTLTWDYKEQILNVDETILVTLTLSVSENIQGITNFFFDIIIIGSGI